MLYNSSPHGEILCGTENKENMYTPEHGYSPQASILN